MLIGSYGTAAYGTVRYGGVMTAVPPIPPIPEPAGFGSPSRPKLVRVVVRSSSAEGDAAHFRRQIVRRAWDR